MSLNTFLNNYYQETLVITHLYIIGAEYVKMQIYKFLQGSK